MTLHFKFEGTRSQSVQLKSVNHRGLGRTSVVRPSLFHPDKLRPLTDPRSESGSAVTLALHVRREKYSEAFLFFTHVGGGWE